MVLTSSPAATTGESPADEPPPPPGATSRWGHGAHSQRHSGTRGARIRGRLAFWLRFSRKEKENEFLISVKIL
jgi:hypothetical protein